MAVLSIGGLSKTFRIYHKKHLTLKDRVVHLGRQNYEEFWAIRDLDLEIDAAETVGLIGANGSGKTTLLKIISGILVPTKGTVTTIGRIAALLELGAGFHPDLTGRENVFMNASILGISRRETERYFDEIVGFAEMERFIDNQVKYYSSGMYVRLAFAVAIHVDPEILLVDEVLAVGDEAFQRKCLDRVKQLQKEGRTIIFVTHAVDLVRQICDRAVLLERGQKVADGSPTETIRAFRGSIHEGHFKSDLEEWGTREVEVVNHALTGTRNQNGVFQPGDAVRIMIDVTPRSPVAEAVLGIAIHDERDQLVYGTNTLRQNMQLAPLDRPTRVEFELASLPMLDGSYSLTIGVHSPDGNVDFHWLERAHKFEVRSKGEAEGLVHLDASCRVTTIDGSDS